MTAFDHFQLSTCQYGEGDKAAAIASLDAAIAQIDRDGVDADLRPDIESLRATIARSQ